MGRIPSLPRHAAPQSVEDVADALQKHLNYTKEQALPLLMCSFTKRRSVHGSPGTRQCSERSK